MPPFLRISGKHCSGGLFTRVRGETVCLPANMGEPPRHEASHGSVHQRFAAPTSSRSFCSSSCFGRSSDRAFHHPSPRQHHEAFGRQQPVPIHGHALFSPLSGSRHKHLFRAAFFGRSTTFTLHPSVFFTQSAPCTPHGSPRPATGDGGEEAARQLRTVAS